MSLSSSSRGVSAGEAEFGGWLVGDWVDFLQCCTSHRVSLYVSQSVFLNVYKTSWARHAIPDVPVLWYSGLSLCASSVSTWSWLSIRGSACWVGGRKPYLAGSSAVWRNLDANWLCLWEPNGSVWAIVLLVPCTLRLWDKDWEQWEIRTQYLVPKEAAEQFWGEITPWELPQSHFSWRNYQRKLLKTFFLFIPAKFSDGKKEYISIFQSSFWPDGWQR